MRTYKSANRIFNVLDTIMCNKCGKTYLTNELKEEWVLQHMHSFKTDFGYGTGYDGQTWKFDLCEDCIIELVNNFKIKPEIFDINS